MKQQCMAEGDLRAWLDRELEPAELESVAAHLNECEACRTLSEELSARAALVMSALAELPVTQRQPRASVWRWAVPVAAMAACLAIAVTARPRVQSPPEVSHAVVLRPPFAPQPPPAGRLVKHTVKRRAVVPQLAPFVALDDEPIETGVVMRVGTESGGFQADVIVGPDGRAHAIRILME